jgi:hypothetical protein
MDTKTDKATSRIRRAAVIAGITLVLLLVVKSDPLAAVLGAALLGAASSFALAFGTRLWAVSNGGHESPGSLRLLVWLPFGIVLAILATVTGMGYLVALVAAVTGTLVVEGFVPSLAAN